MKQHPFFFGAAYALVGLLALGCVVAFAAALKHPARHTRGRAQPHTQVCHSPKCAQVGDHLTVVLDGQVQSVSVPQQGVICVQIGSRTSAGDYCVPS